MNSDKYTLDTGTILISMVLIYINNCKGDFRTYLNQQSEVNILGLGRTSADLSVESMGDILTLE